MAKFLGPWGLTVLFLLCVFTDVGCTASRMAQIQETEKYYQKGEEAWQAKKYDLAVAYFREIPEDSVLYKKAMLKIQSVNYQKGKDAFDQQRNNTALYEFGKVSKDNPNYGKTQQLKALVSYQLTIEQYHRAIGDEKQAIFKKLVSVATQSKDKRSIQEVIRLLSIDIQRASSLQEILSLLNLLQTALKNQSDPEVLQEGLQEVLTIFAQHQNHTALRLPMLGLIADLKLKLRDLRQ
ncbi:hypothetical protein WDW89_06210 [Deltaproteobacteria bacterium TL4]